MAIQCKIINTFISYLIQILLGSISLLSLVIKRRYFEFPKRHFKIWKYDTYKLIISSFFAHCINTIISISISGNLQCDMYFINYIIDTFVGTFISFILIKIINYIAIKYNIPNIETGYYGLQYNNNDSYNIDEMNDNYDNYDNNDKDDNDDNNDNDNNEPLFINEFHNTKKKNNNKLKIFIVQTSLLCSIILYGKLLILFTILLPAKTNLQKISKIILHPISYNNNIELLIVFVVIPLILNSIQFIIYDIILKKKKYIKKNNNNEFETNSLELLYADL